MNTENKFQINRRLHQAVDFILIVMISGFVILVLTAVFFRYILNHALIWSDELLRYLFVWFSMLGAASVFRSDEHIRVDFFIERMPAGVQRYLKSVSMIAAGIFSLAMTVLGFFWVYEMRGAITSALKWPINWFFYAALPVSSLLMFLQSCEWLCRAVQKFRDGRKNPPGLKEEKR